jgi:nonribosomal peptide synthetase DhbF
MRHVLIRIAHENYRLARIFSHIITDGPSSQILNTELAFLYEARIQGIEPPLARVPSQQFADYAVWQRQIMRPDGPYFNEVMTWWKSLISTVPPATRLPIRKLIPRAGLDPSEGVFQWKLEEGTAKRLDQFARSVHATHFTVRLAAFVALIADVTGNSSVVIGTHFVNRNLVDTQNIIGPFVNTTPLVFSYDATKTFLEWLQVVRDRVFETRTHSDLSYEEVKQQLRADGIEPPEIGIVFAMSSDRPDQHFGNLVMSNELCGVGKMPWGCQFFIEAQKPENCRVHFDAGVYGRNGMRAMLDRYLRLLEAAAHEPELLIGKLVAMTGAKPLRWTCRNYAERFYKSSTLLKLFWRQVRKLASSSG